TCMLFCAVSGSAAAAVSSIGGFMIPEMERNAYGRSFSVALTTTSATTGLLIPPSNIMIVFAVVSGNVSVAALFLAGVLPGFLVGIALMGASFVTLHFLAPAEVRAAAKAAAKNASAKAVAAPSIIGAFVRAIPSLLLVVVVLGGILGGLFSATEASAIAV